MGLSESRQPPVGFVPRPVVSPAFETFDPLYLHGAGADRHFDMYVLHKHCNLRRNVHGSFLATLAGIAPDFTLGYQTEPASGFVTVSLSLAYAGNAVEGDRLETQTGIQRRGRMRTLENRFNYCGEQHFVRASGVFTATGEAFSSE